MARGFQALLVAPWFSLFRKKKIRMVMLKTNKGLAQMTEFFEAGTVIPVIDKLYKLSETAEAFRYFGEGLQKGKLVITMK